MYTRIAALVALVAVFASFSAADAAEGLPPSPKAVNGHAVTVGPRQTSSFTFGTGRIFVAGFGDEENPKVTGGVYVLKGGKPVKIPGSPAHVFGLAYSGGTLYVSGGARGGGIYAWSGWNGTRFAKSRVVVAPRKGFTSFNGIAMGPDGKLYAGVSLAENKTDDYSKGSTLYANDVVSVDPDSGTVSVVARGLRQPWQPVFVPGHDGPLIADLGQENLGKKRPIDRVVEAARALTSASLCVRRSPRPAPGTTSRLWCFRRIPRRWGLARSAASSTSHCSAARVKDPRSCRCRSRVGSTHQLSSASSRRSSRSPRTAGRCMQAT